MKQKYNKVVTNKKEVLGLGGAAIAAGGFGCIFLPPLKCKGEARSTGKVVSKLLTTRNAEKEFNEAKEIQNLLKKELGEQLYTQYFIFPEKKCEADVLSKEDLINFNEKCKNLTRNDINVNNINSNLSEVRILELTNGGSDLDNIINTMKTQTEFMKFNDSLINLLTEAIVPMNHIGILHFDLKSPNILIDDDYQMRLIDWGLSVVAKNNTIPKGVKSRPIQYNLPFSTLLFNEQLINRINKGLNKFTFKGDYKSNIKPKLTADIFNIIVSNPTITERGHVGYVSQNIREHFNLDNGKSFFIYNLLTNYITEAILNFIDISKKEFDSVKYFYDISCKNADIWGLLTVYDDVLMNNKKVLKNKPEKKEALKHIVYRYLYSPEFAGTPIDIDILVKELKDVLPLSSSKHIKGDKIQKQIVMNNKTRRKRCPNGTRQDPKTGECVPKNRVNKDINPAVPVDPNVRSIVKKSKVLIGNKTRRKRCPNGTRLDPKTGTCVPKNKNKNISRVTSSSSSSSSSSLF